VTCCLVTHPATEYTHATVELRMLFRVARQLSTKQLVTKYTLCDDEGRQSLLHAAAMMSHGSTLVSMVTLL
jgi:hypothetical protein